MKIDTIPAKTSFAETTDKNSEYTMIAQVAHMYYNLNMLQPEIADKLFFSRSKVSRMLKKARELGIVEVRIRSIPGRVPPFEQQLKKQFGLKDVVVVESFLPDDSEESMDSVVDFASMYISEFLRNGDIVGITRGRTIDKVVARLRKLSACSLQVVQLMGSSTGQYLSTESREIVARMNSTFSTTAHFLNTPLYVDDIYAKEVLLSDPTIQESFHMMKQCSLILTGIGNLKLEDGRNPGWYGYMTKQHFDELESKGAVGSICAQYFDAYGRLIPSEWNSKCMAMPFAEILKNKATVAVAHGSQKVAPVLGALRGGIINVLITDALTASNVLELNKI